MILNRMIQQLKDEHLALSNAIAELERYQSKTVGRPIDPDHYRALDGWTCPKCGRLGNIGQRCSACGRSCRGRKSMTSEERKQVSERMRHYWGARRKTAQRENHNADAAD